jgi:hypothetical protein
VLMNLMQQASPTEWAATASYARRPHGCGFWAVAMMADSAQSSGIDLTHQLLSCGFIDMAVAALSAVEQVGASNCNGCILVTGPLWLLKGLIGEAVGEIEEKVRSIPKSLRYVRDSGLVSIQDHGHTSSVMTTVIAANVYGKDEDNTFGFARECRLRHPLVAALPDKT